MNVVWSQRGFSTLRKRLPLSSGHSIPQVGYGSFLVKREDILLDALRSGYRHIDTASFYDNEKQVGAAVKKGIRELGLKREDVFVTSKVGPASQGLVEARKSVEASLSNLDLEYIDLMLIHWPGSSQVTDAEKMKELRHETWRVLEEFVAAKKVRSIGVSNFQRRHIEDLLKIQQVAPVLNQIEIHPLYVEHDTIACCGENNMVVEAYSSFAKFNPKLIENSVVKKVAQEHNMDVPKTLLLWGVQKGFVVLPKSAARSRMQRNLELEGVAISEEGMAELDELGKKVRFKMSWDPSLIA